jgi:hypothetical protein
MRPDASATVSVKTDTMLALLKRMRVSGNDHDELLETPSLRVAAPCARWPLSTAWLAACCIDQRPVFATSGLRKTELFLADASQRHMSWRHQTRCGRSVGEVGCLVREKRLSDSAHRSFSRSRDQPGNTTGCPISLELSYY